MAGALTGALLARCVNVIGGGTVVVFVCAAVVSLLLLADLAGHPILLQRNAETPREWVDRPAWQWAVWNGAALGSGVWTRIGFPIWYVLPLIGVATASVAITATCWAAYGFVRASMSLIVGGQKIRLGTTPGVARDLLLHPSRRVAADIIALAAVAVLVLAVQ